jgi:hypothetical protein
MDVSLSNQILNTANVMAQAKVAQEVNTTVLKKAWTSKNLPLTP